MIDVSYGVLNYNPYQDERATKCYIDAVESLANNRNPSIKSEVYLIEQGFQPDLTYDLAKKHNFNAVLLQSNVGISRGINMIAKLGRGRFISLVTSDVIFPIELDTKLTTILDQQHNIYQICPASDNAALDHQRQNYSTDLVYNLSQELTIQFWPRVCFERGVGYFDERWKACYENLDFALRIFMLGNDVVVDHKSFCHHEHNMCLKSGALNHSYDAYINMPNGLSHDVLRRIWDNKWPNLNSILDIYANIGSNKAQLRELLLNRFATNLLLDGVQQVSY